MVPVPASVETVYRFLASQANSPCLFRFDPSMKFSPFFAVISTKFIHNRGVCVHLADFTKGLGKSERY